MTFNGSGSNVIGNTTVSAGTLLLSKTGGAIAIPGNLNISGGTVRLTQSNQISPTSTVTINAATGPTLLDLNGQNNTFGSGGVGGLVFIAGGTLSTGTGTATLGGNVNVSSGSSSTATAMITGNLNLGSSARTIMVARGSGAVDLQIAASITGSAGITKAGPGILYLSGASTFAGPINIIGGVLEAASAASLGTATNVVTLDGGTLQFGSAFDPSTAGNLSLPVASALDTQTNTVPIAGSITGGGSLTKLGTGTLVLGGNNSFSGGLDINAGMVMATSDSDLGAAGMPIVLAGGALTIGTSDSTTRQLTLSSAGGTLNASAGTITLNTAPSLGGSLTLTGGTLAFNASTGTASITGSNTLTIMPSATLIDGGSVDSLYLPGTTPINVVNNSVMSFDVTAGSKTTGAITGVGNTNVSAGASLTTPTIRQNTLSDSGNINIVPQAGARNPSATVNIVTSLLISGGANDWTGKLDLANNDMIIHSGSLATITNQIQEGYNSGNWNGTGGIISTSAASSSSHLTALGVIQNNQAGQALYTAANPFDGMTPGTGDILVKFTYYGDATLDGKVDGTDYSRIDNGYLNQLTGWFNGDFNYDGIVNGSDYTLIDNSYNTQGASLAAAIASPNATATAQLASASVPEPASLAMISIAGSALLTRRPRRC